MDLALSKNFKIVYAKNSTFCLVFMLIFSITSRWLYFSPFPKQGEQNKCKILNFYANVRLDITEGRLQNDLPQIH